MPWIPPFERRTSDPERPYRLVYVDNVGQAYIADERGRRLYGPTTDHAEALARAVTSRAIVVLRGTFVLKKTVVINGVSDVKILGSGAKLTVSPTRTDNRYNVLEVFNSSDVVIRGIEVDGNKASLTYNGNRRDYRAIYIDGSQRIVLEKMYIHNVKAGAGISIASSSSVFVRDNVIEDIGDSGENALGDGVYVAKSSYVHLKGNTIRNVTDTGLANDNDQYMEICCNLIDGAGSQGISQYNADDNYPTAFHSVITANVILNSARGIMIGSGGTKSVGNVIINGNQVYSTTIAGIEVEKAAHITIIGNHVRFASPAIRLGLSWSGTGNVYEIIIARNRITDCEDGIVFEANVSIVGLVEANKFIGCTNPIVDNGATALPTIRNNEGYRTENSGVAVLPAGSTSVSVNHGLAVTPAKILITPLGQPAGKLWVANITASTFDIVTDTAPSADLQIAWRAEA